MNHYLHFPVLANTTGDEKIEVWTSSENNKNEEYPSLPFSKSGETIQKFTFCFRLSLE